MSINLHLSRAAFAAAFLLAAPAPLAAQESPRVMSGTITLDNSSDRVQIISNRKARLGVIVMLEASRLTDSIGAVLVAVTPNGPAYRAGLRSGDIVTRFNGKSVTQPAGGTVTRTETSIPGIRLVELAAAMSPGDSGTVQYRRGTTTGQTTIILGDDLSTTWTYSITGRPNGIATTTPGAAQQFDYYLRTDSTFFTPADTVALRSRPMVQRMRTPMPQAFMLNSPLAHLNLAPLNPELGSYFGTAQGVLVINLPDDSRLGLKPGDVVLSVNERPVRSPGHLVSVLMSYTLDEPVQFHIMRQKSRKVVTGTIGEP